MLEYRFEDNAVLSGELAADGMVLLENRDGLLPLENGTRVAVFGRGQLEFSMGGTGSAAVFTAYRIGAIEGLLEQESAGRIVIDHAILDAYRTDPGLEETETFVAQAAERNEAALVILSRNAGEGKDRRDVPGDYRLSAYEEHLLDLLTASAFRKIAVVVNSGGLIDLSFFRRSEKMKSLLLSWQPGMQGGRALARVLCGEVTPSGHLTDTVARSYADYPTSGIYQKYRQEMIYEEDIFVGYRYFETVPGAGEKVLYPFGFGLSYTTFELKCGGLTTDGGKVRCRAEVTNTGSRSGREVVQLYSASPADGKLDHPARELRGFAKTKLLAPGESQTIEFEIPADSLAAFDDTGTTGAPEGSFVLERGKYRFFLGTDVRSAAEIGTMTVDSLRVLASPGLLLQRGLSRRMHADGSFDERRLVEPYCDLPNDAASENPVPPEKRIMLEAVAEGKHTMEEFLSQLSRKELYHLTHGQPSLFPTGTSGFGNLRRWGVPNPQTSDGPAGLRKAVPTTCFPCATLVACSWDRDLQFRMGAALGREGIASDVDILLAPGLNIHRDPLCGRNFEYFSEDPLAAGRTAAALVSGIQSEGLGATLKHFAVNSRENYRKFTDSVVSERALREIYLRGFEIAVKTAHPWCVMSSYNLINGEKASCNYNLLVRILREEWGFDGLVMTDWTNLAPYWKELIAGNDLKMPNWELAEYAAAGYVDSFYHMMPRKVLERNAAHVLGVVMKTNRFRKRDFGRIYRVGDGKLELAAAEMTAVLNGRSKLAERADGGICHCNLKSTVGAPQELIFALDVKRAGAWKVSFRLATDKPGSRIRVLVDDRDFGGFVITPTEPRRSPEAEAADPLGKQIQSFETQGDVQIELPEGECELKVEIATIEIARPGVCMDTVTLSPADRA
ncbi:MAG: glycoside hydrolase family 3 C-terminal domain-containing protein [Lentisphaeria bacterium]|nr:glycoside hydrolase family 3 C-terminal domain-containing protein [Lentisphaeria bacterium]